MSELSPFERAKEENAPEARSTSQVTLPVVGMVGRVSRGVPPVAPPGRNLSGRGKRVSLLSKEGEQR